MGIVRYSGPVASFHCPTKATIRSLKVHFSPKQLGSGTPSPENVRPIEGWTGVEVEQRGKNLFDANNPNIISPNCWVSSNGDKKITASNADRSLYISCLPNTTYIIRKTVGNVLGAGYTTDFPTLNMPTYSYMRDSAYARQVTVTTGSDAKYLAIWFYDSSKTYDRTVQPEDIYKTLQIEYGSTATPYEPYHGSTTNYEFGVLGKNKFPLRASNQFLNTSTGWSNTNARDMTTGDVFVNISSNNYWNGRSNGAYGMSIGDGSVSYHTTNNSYGMGVFVSVSPNTEYTLSHAETAAMTRIGYYDSEGKHLNVNLSFTGTSRTFTTTADTAYILVVFAADSTGTEGDYTVSNIQLELGSTATAYEPYDPNKTVYGGWVDLISGEVQQEYDKIILDGSFNPGIFPWAADTEDENGTIITHALYLKRDTYDNKHKRDASAYCDQLQWYNINNVRNKIGFGMYDGSSYSACLMLPKELVGDTNETLNSYLSANPITIVSELATPIIYNLAPTSLQTFLGQNNIWSNADYVEVEYDLHETQNILARKQFIMANQPHIVKPAAAPLQNFVTDMAAPLKECKVYFSPMQKGAGDPSPDNVRPITGWDGITVQLSGRNLIRKGMQWEPNRLRPNNDQVLIGSSYWTCVVPVPKGIISIHQGHANGGYINYVCLADKIPVHGDKAYKTACKPSYTNYTIDNSDGHPYLLIHGPTIDDPLPPEEWSETNHNYILIEQFDSNVDNTPKDGATIPIDWSSAGTVYGGYVDLVTGEVVEERRVATPENIAIRMRAGTAVIFNSGKAIRCYVADQDAPCIKSVNWTVECTHMRDCGPVGNWSMDASSKDGFVAEAQGNSIMFIASELGFTTKDEWAQWVIDNDVKYIYPLSTPIHHPIDPITLKTLRGANNIWSNANGNIELSYWKH